MIDAPLAADYVRDYCRKTNRAFAGDTPIWPEVWFLGVKACEAAMVAATDGTEIAFARMHGECVPVTREDCPYEAGY